MRKSKHAKRAAAILLTLTMLCACSVGMAANDWSQGTIGTTTGSTTVAYYATVRYATPLYVAQSADYGYYGTLDTGDSVGVVTYGTQYCYVGISGRYGYVLTDALNTSNTGNSGTIAYYVKTNTTTQLYRAPNSSGDSYGSINPNISLGVISTSGMYYYVSVSGYYGYVLQSACTNTSSTVSNYVTTMISTPLYVDANTAGAIRSTLTSGRSLGVISTSGSFYYVYVDGTYGYVLVSACYGSGTGSTGGTVSYYLTTNVSTVLYRTTNTAGEVYKTLPSGSSVGVISTSGSLYYVYVDGYYGYVPTSAFAAGGTTGTTVSFYVKTNFSTPLYKNANTSGESYGNLNPNVTLGVISTSGNLYYATVDGYYGYVLSSACTATTNGNVTATTVVASGTVSVGATLYASASTSGTPIGTISAAGKINIISQTTTGFYYVKVGAYYGYILSTMVSVTNDATVIPYSGGTAGATTATVPLSSLNTTGASGNITIAQTGTIGNCISWVSLRESAAPTSARLAKLDKGVKVTIQGTSGAYTKVSYGGTTGYVLSTYVA